MHDPREQRSHHAFPGSVPVMQSRPQQQQPSSIQYPDVVQSQFEQPHAQAAQVQPHAHNGELVHVLEYGQDGQPYYVVRPVVHPPTEPVQAMRMASQPNHSLTQARRIRWETIVPMLGIVLLLAAGVITIRDFDRLSGKSVDPASTAIAATDAESGDAQQKTAEPIQRKRANSVIREATRLMKTGNYEAALSILQPVLSASNTPRSAIRLEKQITARQERVRELLAQAGRQDTAAKWTPLMKTLAQIERFRPLTPALKQMRSRAKQQKAIAARKRAANQALSKATNLGNAGRYTDAINVLNAALARGTDPRLSKLRVQLIARRASRTERDSQTIPRLAETPPAAGGGSSSGAASPSRPAAAPPSAGDGAAGGAPPTAPPVVNNGGPGDGGVAGGDPHANH